MTILTCDMVPCTVYGTVFENQETKELSLDLGTIRYHVDGSRIAAKQLMEEMHPEARRRTKPVKIIRLVLDREKANEMES